MGDRGIPEHSPPVFVPKLDDSIRVCIDFWQLNAVSTFYAYPMPWIKVLLHHGTILVLTHSRFGKRPLPNPAQDADKEKTPFAILP